MIEDNNKLTMLEKRLGYSFNNVELLEQALTHSSARVMQEKISDNERLEFLGDRVLGLTIAGHLYQKFPKALEGELAKRFNGLVRMETCEKVARNLEVGTFLILSDSERLTGGHDKSTILADACEAIIGAVYLDGGYEAARDLIVDIWAEYFDKAVEIPRDPKSALQEWAQLKKFKLPRYDEIERKGPDHAPYFIVEVQVGALLPEKGEGNTKRAAQQNAARNLLIREKVWSV